MLGMHNYGLTIITDLRLSSSSNKEVTRYAPQSSDNDERKAAAHLPPRKLKSSFQFRMLMHGLEKNMQ